MGHPRRTLLGLLAAVALASVAAAAQAAPKHTFTKNLERTVPVAADNRVAVENLDGQVQVSQGGLQLQVTATVVAGGDDMAAARALADTIRLDVTQSSGQVLVHVNYPVKDHDTYQYIPTHPEKAHRGGLDILGMHIGYSNSSSSFDYQGESVRVYQGRDKGVPLHVDLAIQLPASIHAKVENRVGLLEADNVHDDLDLRTASGDIHASGVTGQLEMHSGSGDEHVSDVHGSVDAHSGSGDIALNAIEGSASVHTGSGDITGGNLHGTAFDLHTGSGDIKFTGIDGNLTAETGSGDVKLHDLAHVTRARVDCGSGDIGLYGDLSALQDFKLSSGSGDITVASTRPPAVHLDIRGSDIDVHWPGLSNTKSGRRYFQADVGKATGRGRITSGSGDITLR